MDKFLILIAGFPAAGNAVAPMHKIHGLRRNIEKLNLNFRAIQANIFADKPLGQLPKVDILHRAALLAMAARLSLYLWVPQYNPSTADSERRILFISALAQPAHQWVSEALKQSLKAAATRLASGTY